MSRLITIEVIVLGGYMETVLKSTSLYKGIGGWYVLVVNSMRLGLMFLF